ncbi:MAG: peptidylprolyl isomerase, partial [Vicinamibacterales bacterium]
MTHIVLRIATALAACAGLASAAGIREPIQAPASGEVMVRIETQLGNIDAAVDPVHAPLTANNFLKYVDAGMYDGGRFWRSTRPDNYVPHLPDRPPFQIIQADINA